MTLDDAFEELANGQEAHASGGGGGGGGGGDPELLARIAELEKQKSALAESRKDEDKDREAHGGAAGGAAAAVSLNEQEIKGLYAKSRECKELCGMLDRGMLEFEPTLKRGAGDEVASLVKVVNKASRTEESIVISGIEFLKVRARVRSPESPFGVRSRTACGVPSQEITRGVGASSRRARHDRRFTCISKSFLLSWRMGSVPRSRCCCIIYIYI